MRNRLLLKIYSNVHQSYLNQWNHNYIQPLVELSAYVTTTPPVELNMPICHSELISKDPAELFYTPFQRDTISAICISQDTELVAGYIDPVPTNQSNMILSSPLKIDDNTLEGYIAKYLL